LPPRGRTPNQSLKLRGSGLSIQLRVQVEHIRETSAAQLSSVRSAKEGVYMAPTKKAMHIYEHYRRQQAWREAEVARVIASNYTSSLMSNTKWGRLFRVLKDSEAKISRCRWKLVDSEHTRLTTFPDEWTRQAVCVEWDYDWIPWKHIEWVEFETSDAARAQEVLNGHGKFDMQRIEQRLRGYGYRG